VYRICESMNTLGYEIHFYAYVIQGTDNLVAYKSCDLLDHHPLGLYEKGADGYVALKYEVKHHE